jgi:hypothetical protein
MQYKSIVLEMLKQRPQLHERLRQERRLLHALDFLSRELKASHEAQKAILSRARPGSHPQQIASEALELALRELEASLPPASPPDESETFCLDEAMAFLRHKPTSPG